jgi:hypothetical protein
VPQSGRSEGALDGIWCQMVIEETAPGRIRSASPTQSGSPKTRARFRADE